jgi:hypothetical protein
VSDSNDIDPNERRPDIEIGAAVKAKRLRFTHVPDTEVELHGDEGSGSIIERVNLPDEVEPGVEYGDVEMRWLAAARIEVQQPRRTRENPGF